MTKSPARAMARVRAMIVDLSDGGLATVYNLLQSGADKETLEVLAKRFHSQRVVPATPHETLLRLVIIELDNRFGKQIEEMKEILRGA